MHPRVNESFNPNQTLHDIVARMESRFDAAIHYKNREVAEAEYRQLERLIAENNGPTEFTQFVAQGRAIWRKRKADRADAAYNSTPDCRFPLRSDPVFPSRIDPGEGMSRRAGLGSSW